jgi:hypothetical protein
MADHRHACNRERTEALVISDELAQIAEVYGTECRDHVRAALAANPDIHWMTVVDLEVLEWDRNRRAILAS